MPGRSASAHRAATRNDVARLAGVSTAVVSYVINGGPKRVAPDTARRVHAAVAQLGYRPNLTARALQSGSTQLIGLVLPEWISPFFAELTQAIAAAAAARQHALVITASVGDPLAERQQVAGLEARRVDGLLISSLLPPPVLGEWFRQRPADAPRVVLLNCDRPVPGVVGLGPGFFDGAYAASEHLRQHGHRRIALATGSLRPQDREPREQGWRAAIKAAGLRPGPVARTHYSREGGYEAGRRLLGAASPPTAVFAASDLMAVGVLRAAHELGVRVPEHLAVIAFDGTRESEFSWPPLTAVRQPIDEMAEASVRLVLGDDAGASHQVFPTTLVVRRSCGCDG